MTDLDRQRVKQIFAEAIEKPAGQRTAFIDDLCGGDAALRARVEQLLRMHDTAGEFLVEPTSGFGMARFGPSAVPGESVGDVIGNYTLVKLLGEGGFGTVYLAEQQHPVRRQVALKIIKLGMDTRSVIARFDAEKQALAMMDHPSIARVFDAGATDTGRPYFVMEYVPGVPITQFCDERHCTAHERLELLMSVCGAVQHAHQKGIIHRDIKPSNVLVSTQDERPLVKVIDFGIAKATEARLTEKTVFTEERQLIGTPQYMSPEQADLGARDIDTRSDIYSLGVLLYELLAGAPPFDPQRLRSAGYNEIQRIIREEDPPRPSTRLGTLDGSVLASIASLRQSEPAKLTKLVRGDLDWIVMRAMEKDRARRYETASALADDIRRHLDDEPVLASPPGAAYRVRKFVRRHRSGVLAGALVVLALVSGATLATVGFVQARRERAEAVRQRAYAEDRQREAERQTRIAQAVNEFLTEDLLAAADPHNLGRNVTVREVLEEAGGHVEERFKQNPTVEAAVRSTLGHTYWRLGELGPAEAHLERALELHRARLGEEHPETLTSYNRLANLYRAQGRLADAEPIYLDVLEKRKRVLGPEHKETLSSMHNLAGLYRDQGRLNDALPVYRQALELCRKTLPPEDSQRLNALEGLAGMYKDLGRYPEAEPLYLEVLAMRRKLYGDAYPSTLRTMNNLAVIYSRLGRYDESERIYLEVLAREREISGEDHPETLVTMTNLAKQYYLMRRFDDAVALYTDALERGRRVLGEGHRGNLITMDGLGQTYVQMRRYEDAEKVLTDALALNAGAAANDSIGMLLLNNLALVYLYTGRLDAADETAARAVATARRSLPAGHWFTAEFLITRGEILLKQQRWADAQPVLLEAHQTMSAALGPDHRNTARAARYLTSLYEGWGKPEEASKWRARSPSTAPQAG